MKKFIVLMVLVLAAIPIVGLTQESFRSAGKTSVRIDTTMGSKAQGRIIYTKSDGLLWLGMGNYVKQICTSGDTIGLSKLKVDTLESFSTDSIFTAADMVFLQDVLVKLTTGEQMEVWGNKSTDTLLSVYNDRTGLTARDSSFVVLSTGAVVGTNSATFGATATPVVISTAGDVTAAGHGTFGTVTVGKNLTVNATEGAESITAPMVTGGWTLGFDTGGWSITAGVLSKTASTGTQTATAVSGMTITPVAHSKYKVVIVCSAVSGTLTYTLGGVTGTTITATTITDYIVARTTDKIILSGGASVTCTITSISIKKLTDDTGEIFAPEILTNNISAPGSGTRAIYISPTGNVGVGSEAYTAKLYSYTASGTDAGMYGYSSAGQGIYGLSNYNSGVFGSSTESHGVAGTSTIARAGYFYRNNALGTATLPVVEINQLSSTSETNTALKVVCNGTGDILNLFDGANEVATVVDGGSVGIGTTAPLTNSLTLGTKGTQRDFLLTRENVPAGTDSSIYGKISSGVPYWSLKAADGDTLSLWHDGSSGYIASHTGLGLKVGNTTELTFDGTTTTSYNNFDPATADNYTLGSSAGWKQVNATDYITLGGKGQTAEFYLSTESTFAGTDSSIFGTVASGVPVWRFNGSDGDQYQWSINTSDEAILQNAAGLTLDTGTALKLGTLQWDVVGTDSINGANLGARTLTGSKHIAVGTIKSNLVDSVGVDGIVTHSQYDAVYDQVNISLDDAHAMAADTTWFWGNNKGATITVDSIRVEATTDDQDVNVVKRNWAGGGATVVDAVTASTNGSGEVFYATETSITSAELLAGWRVGLTKPSITSDNILITIFYHYTRP